MKPEDEMIVRELALSLIRQPAGEGSPPEIVITYRKHEDYEQFIRQIAELTEKLKRAEQQVAVLSHYASENIRLYDQLCWAHAAMVKAGLDVSFITSIRQKPQKKLKGGK